MRFEIRIGNAFHNSEPLVAATFVDGENEDHMRVLFVSIVELFGWAECGRPDIVVLRYLHTL